MRPLQPAIGRHCNPEFVPARAVSIIRTRDRQFSEEPTGKVGNVATPKRIESYLATATELVSWEMGKELLGKADAWLLASVRDDGSPHMCPVLALWSGDDLVFCTSSTSVKARNIGARSAVSLTGTSPAGFLVVEGNATHRTDDLLVDRAAEAYRDRFGWDPEPRNGQFHGKGAPTAGAGPFSLYLIEPRKAFAFGQVESFPPTRFLFD
jgi:hypothetical protein